MDKKLQQIKYYCEAVINFGKSDIQQGLHNDLMIWSEGRIGVARSVLEIINSDDMPQELIQNVLTAGFPASK